MPVQSTHPEYDASLAAWQRARGVIAGEDAVKRVKCFRDQKSARACVATHPRCMCLRV